MFWSTLFDIINGARSFYKFSFFNIIFGHKKVINLGFSASTGWSGTTSHLRYCFGTPHFHESSTHPSLNIRNCQAISDIQMIENIIMSSHAPQIDVNGLIVVYRFLALLIKWWCSGGNRTRTLQITGRRLSMHGHPSGPGTFSVCSWDCTDLRPIYDKKGGF